MIGTIVKAVGTLITIVFWVVVLRYIDLDLAPAVNFVLSVVLLALMAWGAWIAFKAACATSLVDSSEPPVVLFVSLIVLGVVFSYARKYVGGQEALIVVGGFALAAFFLVPPLARAGIARWEREQRGSSGSGLYGSARFIVFDADLDKNLYSRLHHPWGSAPLLGFYEANLLPTFFHRLLFWPKHPKDALQLNLRGYRVQPLIYDGPSHLLTIAPARSGKGSCVIIPNLLSLKRSVICIDPKGENAAVTRRHRSTFSNVYLLNPFNEHGFGTSRFNPLAHLDINSRTLVADVAGLSEALIITEGKEPFFTDSARDLVKAIMLHLVATKGSDATLPQMRRLLTLPSGDGENDKFGLLILEMTRSPHSFIAQPASRFQHVDKTTQSIISTAIAQTSFLDDPAIVDVLSGNDFSLRDFKKSLNTLYIILPARYLAAYSRFFRLVVVSALDQLTASPGGGRVTLLLDEFAQLGHLSAVETALGLAAGFNVQLWPFLQDLNQLKDIYKSRWETFMANAGVVQWFAPNDMTTAQYLSNRLGQRTAVTTSSTGGGTLAKLVAGSGGSTTKGETGVPLRTPQDLMALDGDVGPNPIFSVQGQILTVAGIDRPIRCHRAPYDALVYKLAENIPTSTRYRELKGFWKSGSSRTDYDPNPFHEPPKQDPPAQT